MSAERDKKTKNVENFPPMTDLAHFHDVVGKISDCVGDDHNDVPLALVAIVLRPGDIEQFSLIGGDHVLSVMGALDIAKLTLIDSLVDEEDG